MKKQLFQAIGIIAVSAFLFSCGGNKPDDKSNEAKDTLKTVQNLKTAITGETTASAKYAAFSAKAKEEGYEQISKFFEATSMSESIHAKNHLAVPDNMGEKFEAKADSFSVGTTKENLEDAIKGESYEVETMYPEFITIATADSAAAALQSFNYAFLTEMKHKALYQEALIALNDKKVKDLSMEYYVCPTCGNTFTMAAIEKFCSFCTTAQEKFILIK